MNIIIQNATGSPIYEQIFTQIMNAILEKELAPGDPLPSVRNLAKDLRVSVITTTRAYEELEKAGFIYRVPGKGTYVSEQNLELVQEEYLRQIEEKLEDIKQLSGILGLTLAQVQEMVSLIWEERI